MFCVCILCVFCVCFVCVLCVFCVCVLFVCFVCVLCVCVLFVCFVCVLCVFCVCVLCVCFVRVLCVFCVCVFCETRTPPPPRRPTETPHGTPRPPPRPAETPPDQRFRFFFARGASWGPPPRRCGAGFNSEMLRHELDVPFRAPGLRKSAPGRARSSPLTVFSQEGEGTSSLSRVE